MFDVKLGCDEEARQVLQASLTDPSIQHAVSSLRALREDLETSGDNPAFVAQQTPSYDYGLQQYSMALGGLAFSFSSPGSNVASSSSALSKVKHEYRARPGYFVTNKLVPAHHDQMPFLLMNLAIFARLHPTCGELTMIAASTLEFLGKVSQVESTEIRPPGSELISVSFMRIFHLILKIVLSGALDSSADLYAQLRTENDRLQGVANNRSLRGAFSNSFCSDHHSEHRPQVRQPFRASALPPRFLADSVANYCEVLEHAGIHRIVVMSTAGVGDSWTKLPWLSKGFMGWTNIKYALEDHGLVDKEILMTKMDWTLVRASRLEFDDSKQGGLQMTRLDGSVCGLLQRLSTQSIGCVGQVQ
ncbi:hypothetical protein G7Y79_00009g026500 [Physcia stellaris]|nr:hypothetical protein G7Y79_00009g026500 [Physcia stellaris]